MRGVLRRKHYSIRTEQSYVDWIKRFILFNAKRHPAQMGKPEVNAFLTHLATQRNVAASTQNQALSIGGRAAEREGGRWKEERFQVSVSRFSDLTISRRKHG